MKVEDYVRTKIGQIGKIVNVEDYYVLGQNDKDKFSFVLFNNSYAPCIVSNDFIIKKGQLIDLIEENDYVNGLRVDKNKYGELYTSYVYYGGDIGKQCEVYTTWLKEYTEDMIESILTHEQFNSMEYKIGE